MHVEFELILRQTRNRRVHLLDERGGSSVGLRDDELPSEHLRRLRLQGARAKERAVVKTRFERIFGGENKCAAFPTVGSGERWNRCDCAAFIDDNRKIGLPSVLLYLVGGRLRPTAHGELGVFCVVVELDGRRTLPGGGNHGQQRRENKKGNATPPASRLHVHAGVSGPPPGSIDSPAGKREHGG